MTSEAAAWVTPALARAGRRAAEQEERKPMGWVFAAIGLFAICGAVLDWEWFMNNRKAQSLVGLIGRPGARIFYGLLGTALAVLGVLMALGIVQES